MPAGAEAIRAERTARRARAAAVGQPAPVASTGRGAAIVRSAWVGAAFFVAATLLAVLAPGARLAVVIIDLALLLAGCVIFLLALAVAAGRSRDRQIGLWELFLLESVAPPRVRAELLGALAAQVVVAAATCWITPALAFGLLVPVWGLAHCGLWGARHGAFDPRPLEGAAKARHGGPKG